MLENKKKKPGRTRKILFLTLIGLLVVFALYVGFFFLTLPDVSHLGKENPATTALMEQRKQEAAAQGKVLKIHQRWLSFQQIPELLKLTVRVSEDGAFYQHKGIDYHELMESIKRNIKEGKSARGGSTITQQLAKNLFLSTEKSYLRKIKEFFIARQLEKHLSKDRIFCIYLNVIELGPGVFGVGAAAQYYFKKPASSLSLEEIVRLAAVLPKPLRVTPLSNSKYLKWRATLLLDRLKRYGYISDGQYKYTRSCFR